MKRGSDDTEQQLDAIDSGSALCASCDRCRARKTRCDGQKPCSNCAAKYMKKHKLTSIAGIDLEEFECVYSPAKRRGPVPGRTGPIQTRKTPETTEIPSQSMDILQQQALGGPFDDGLRQMMFQQQGMGLGGADLGGFVGINTGLMDTNGVTSAQLQHLNYLQQLGVQSMNTEDDFNSGRAQRIKTDSVLEKPSPDTVAAHMPLLSRQSTEGNRLRALYRLSVDELFTFPPIPTDQEYCIALGMNPALLPLSHQHALNASRFAEIALGAVVHNEVSLAMELSNATVQCLRESVKEPVQVEYAYEIVRAYFLLGCFRAFRGDMVRYFKYRRVCMRHLAMFEALKGSELLLAAIAYLDAWAYMMYNANENKLPNIDDSLARVKGAAPRSQTEIERKYGTCCGASAVASDPNNQMWIQGAPPIYLNNEAPLNARSLDAIACAIRSCCDHANNSFAEMSKEVNSPDEIASEIPEKSYLTVTNSAVMAHEDELCSRNIVLSAFTLLQQHEASTGTLTHHNQGHHLIISALDAFLEPGDEDGSGGFTDSQVQSLLSVCNTAIENPLLLHHGGPTYHMVTNAAILLCHLMNGMHAMDSGNSNGSSREMEAAVFEEVLDTFLSVRKLLNIHRRKLPVKLRCHGIPRPSMKGPEEGKPFVDLGETLMCGCRGCQGFVLMACSPCVAAERAKSASMKRQIEEAREAEAMLDGNDLDKALYDLETEFDLDDDALLNMLSQIVTA